MKVLIIMPWIRQGGAELIAVRTAYHLQKKGYQIKLAALFVDTAMMDSVSAEIGYIQPKDFFSGLFKRSKFLLYFVGPFVLFWLVLKNAVWADVLFPHSLPSYWIAAIIASIFHKKVIWLCNEPPKRRRLSEMGFCDWLMWFIADSFVDKLLVGRIDRIIVYSEGVAGEVKQRYGKEAEVIRLGIDFDFFARRDEKIIAKLTEKYGLAGKFVLLTVGKLHPQKNQRLAVGVLKNILPVIKNAVLVFVGNGPDEEYLKKRVKKLNLEDKVIFAGFCSPEMVRSWYSVCDLVISPSVDQTAMVSQSWGFVPFEALCQQKLSIVPENSGAAEVIKKEKIGFVLPVTVKTFTKQVMDYHQNREKYLPWAQRGRQYVKANLTWGKFGKEIGSTLAGYRPARRQAS